MHVEYLNGYNIQRDTYINQLYDQIIPLFEKYLGEKFYSPEVNSLSSMINCTTQFNSTAGKKFSKKGKFLFFDVIIPYDEYISLKTETKKKECIALSFLRDMEVLSRFKPKDFNLSVLKNDCEVFFQNIGWLTKSA